MKRFIFYALDQYTLKVYRRKEWEAGVRHGIACEQQRIIKLLEEASKPKCDSEACNCWDIQGLEEAIELIEGEK